VDGRGFRPEVELGLQSHLSQYGREPNMASKKVGVAPGVKLQVAKRLPTGKEWRIVAPGKVTARRASLLKKFTVDGKTFAIFHVLPGTR
jgi:hypothetical protein